MEEKKRLFVNLEDRSIRMFENNFLDFFSRVHWTVPIFVYMPVIGFSIYLTVIDGVMSIPAKFGLFFLGIFAWSFFEYFMHRFVFHYHPTSELGKKIHFMTHGVHHDYPQDSMRLVMPPIVSLPLATLFYFVFWGTLGSHYMWPIYGGFVLGYLAYDILHYATHHFTIHWKWFKFLRKHHMEHHYGDPDKGFGVSSTLWDIIFRSGFNKKEK